MLALSYRQQNGLFVSGSSDGSAILWTTNNQKNQEEEDDTLRICQQHHRQMQPVNKKIGLVGHSGPVWCVELTSEMVISGSYDKTIKFWDTHTGKCLSTLRGHSEWVSCLTYCEKDGKGSLLSGSWDASVKMWDM